MQNFNNSLVQIYWYSSVRKSSRRILVLIYLKKQARGILTSSFFVGGGGGKICNNSLLRVVHCDSTKTGSNFGHLRVSIKLETIVTFEWFIQICLNFHHYLSFCLPLTSTLLISVIIYPFKWYLLYKWLASLWSLQI